MKKRPVHRWKPLALAVLVAFNPGYVSAQVVPVNGAATKSALNGVPVVDIVAPNAARVSHNKYARFNVGAGGLVLNNSATAVVTTLGGGVAGNPNLAGGAARLILNEVVQANRSTLNGFIEVGGAAADVVLANPAGITCNGCGFVNTPRATLTTGTPNLGIDGGLTGFSVRQGDIAVTGTGLDATGQTAFDLLARVVTLQGQVNARDLVVAGGAHDFNYATRAVSAATGSGAAPTFGIDSSALGGMYVDRVRLIATEAGVGVRLLGEVGATVDDVTLTASGQIRLLSNLTGLRDVTVSGGSVVADGATVAAGRNLSLTTAGAMTLTGGILGADGNALFRAGTLMDNGGSDAIRFADGTLTLDVTGAANVTDATWNGQGSLVATAASLQAGAGTQFSSANTGLPSGSVSIATSGNLGLGNAQVAAGTSVVLAGTGVTLGADGKVESGAATQITASGAFTNEGSVAATGALTISANALSNDTDASLLGGALTVNVTSTLTNAGLLQGADGTIAAQTLDNDGTIRAGDASGGLTVTSNAISNGGRMESAGDLSVLTRGTLSNTGTILAGDALSIGLRTPATDTLVLDNAGRIEAGGTLAIRGRETGARNLTITNRQAGTMLGGMLDVLAQNVTNLGIIEGEGGSLDAASLTNGSASNSTAAIVFSGAGTTGSIVLSGTLENHGLLFAANDLSIDGTGALNNRGTAGVFAGQDLTLRASSIFNIGAVVSGRDMLLAANTFLNELTLDANGITGAGEVFAQRDFTARGRDAGTAMASFVNHSAIDAWGHATVTATAFTNETVAPATIADSEWHPGVGPREYISFNVNDALALLDGGWVNRTNDNPLPNFQDNQRGQILNSMQYQPYLQNSGAVTAYDQFLEGNVQILLSTTHPDSSCNLITGNSGPCADFYQLHYNANYTGTPPNPAANVDFENWWGYEYLYRHARGPVYSGRRFVTDPRLNQASFKAMESMTLNVNTGRNAGAVLATTFGDLNVNALGGGASFTNTSLDLTGAGLKTAVGITREKWWCSDVFECYNLSSSDYMVLLDLVDQGRAASVSSEQNVSAIAFVGGTMQAGGTVRFTGITPANGTRNNAGISPASSFVGGNGPLTPSGTTAADLPPVLNLALPTNPNGLFVLNTAPDARYLIETNPRFTSLESPEFGSDYLVERLGLNPDTVLQRLGDPRYENRLVSQQIQAQTGLAMLKTAGNADEQMKMLMDNAAWAASELKLTLGVALTELQVNALKQDIVWMEKRTVAGREVLVPVVYLANPARALVNQDSKIVAQNLAVADAASFVNMGTVDVEKSVSIRTAGDIVNVDGVIRGGDVDLASARGNVLNVTTVTRFGDADNHEDLRGRTATIAATSSLNLEATQGSVTSIGGDLKSDRDASVRAGRDVTLQNIVTEKKTTVEYSSGNWFTGESTTRIVTVDQESQAATLSARGNLNVNAGNAVNVTGSQVSARNNVDVQAREVNVTNATTTDSRYEYRSSSGWGSGGGVVGYQSSSTETNTTSTSVVASGITGGQNVTIQGTRSVTVQGSDVQAGNDLAVRTQNLTTREARETGETTVHTSSLSIGVTGQADGNSVSWKAGGSKTDTDESSSYDVARSTTLRSTGGNVTLDATGGTISHQGTQIEAGRDFSQQAQTIGMTAAENRFSSSRDSTTSGGMAGGGVYYNAQRTADQLRSGQSPSSGLPSVMSSGQGEHSTSDASQSRTEAVTTNIAARGNLTSRSTGTTTMEGSQLQSADTVAIQAGRLDFRAAQNTASESSSSMSAGGGAQGGIDARGKPVGGAQGNYADSSSSSSSTTAVTGSIVSNRATVIQTTGDARFEGTNLRSDGTTSIDAGGNVQFDAARNTASSSSSSQSYAGAVGQDSSGTGDNKQGSGSFGNASGSSSSSTAVVGSIDAQRGIRVTAGQSGDVVMEGTNVTSRRGDVTVSAGRDVRMEAARSTASSDGTSFGGNLAVAPGDKREGGGSFDAAGNYANQSSSSTVETGGALSGRNVSISAGRDTLLHGTDVAATQGRASITTGGALTMQSAQSSSTSSGAQYGGELGAAQGTKRGGDESSQAGGAHAGFDVGMQGASSVSNRNAQVSGGEVSIRTGGDMTMRGANVSGGQVGVEVGGNLVIESRVDSSSSSSTQVGGYLGGQSGFDRDASGKRAQYGGDLRTGISGHLGLQSSEASRVTQQSGITGGDTTVNVLTGTTTLQGGLITGGRSELNTRSLTQSDLQVSSASSSLQGGAGLTSSTQQLPGGSRSSDSSSGTVRSVVGSDERIEANLNVAQMSRVLNQPAVQTALQLNKGMKAAAAQFGGADKVPADALRTVLARAGIKAPANADATALRTLVNASLESGYSQAQTQLARSDIPSAQAAGILKAIVP